MPALSALQNLFQVKFNNLFPGQTDFSLRVTVKKSEREEREKHREEKIFVYFEKMAQKRYSVDHRLVWTLKYVVHSYSQFFIVLKIHIYKMSMFVFLY